MNEIKDITINYMVTKKENSKPNMKKLIKRIYHYIQNNEIYFKYEPKFYKGILIFSIVGFPSDHTKLQKILKNRIKTLKCELKVAD